jgi:hypothetical protein
MQAVAVAVGTLLLDLVEMAVAELVEETQE